MSIIIENDVKHSVKLKEITFHFNRYYGGGEAISIEAFHTDLSDTNHEVDGIKNVIPQLNSFKIESSSGIFDIKDVILNEKYTNPINICSKVIEFTKDFVTCECLVDKEEMIFENRTFPAILFENIKPLQKDVFVLLTVKSKPGSIKYDVYKGENYFDTGLFNRIDKSKKIWEKLENVNFDDPFDFSIE